MQWADIDGARAAPPGLGGSGGSAAAAAPVSTAPARASLDRSEVRAPRHSSENTGGPYGGRHQRPSYHERSAPVKYLLFGDSFVRLFGLVKHREIKLQAFKGSSAKGLTREGNENRDAIERTLAENPQAELTLTPTQRAAFCPSTQPSTHPPIHQPIRPSPQAELALFVFGNVDVHLSWFWCKYYKKSAIDLDTIAEGYVEYVAALPGWQKQRRMIVGVYPSQARRNPRPATLRAAARNQALQPALFQRHRLRP